jgi:hypothetical protein
MGFATALDRFHLLPRRPGPSNLHRAPSPVLNCNSGDIADFTNLVAAVGNE